MDFEKTAKKRALLLVFGKKNEEGSCGFNL
jgi:hypothetical protein